MRLQDGDCKAPGQQWTGALGPLGAHALRLWLRPLHLGPAVTAWWAHGSIAWARARLQTRLAALERREAAAAQQADAAAVAARQRFAGVYEGLLFGGGHEGDVTTEGRATTLRVEWALASKVLAHRLTQEPAFVDQLRAMGFTRFEITNGDDARLSWTL